MMDFGFGSFFEKFEEHLGKRALRVLLVLIGAAVALFCAKLIWDTALGPVIRAGSNLGLWETVGFAAWTGVGLVIGSAISTLIAGSFVRWREARAYRNALRRAEGLLEEMKSHRIEEKAERDEMMNQTRATLQEAEEMSARAAALAEVFKEEVERLKKK